MLTCRRRGHHPAGTYGLWSGLAGHRCTHCGAARRSLLGAEGALCMTVLCLRTSHSDLHSHMLMTQCPAHMHTAHSRLHTCMHKYTTQLQESLSYGMLLFRLLSHTLGTCCKQLILAHSSSSQMYDSLESFLCATCDTADGEQR